MNEVTRTENIIIPEVMGEMINAKIAALAKITKYAKVDTTLVGVPGDSKTVPRWEYIGDAENIEENGEVQTRKLTASSTTFSVGAAIVSVGISQKAINSGLGDPIGQGESQLAKSIMGKVDADLLTAALGGTNVHDGSAAVIGYDAIVDAVTKFEDEEDGIEKVMFINPKQEKNLLKDPDFLSADKFQAGVAVNGAIGKIAGCWIKKSKRVPKVEAVSAVSGVSGVWEITIGTKAVANDRLKVNGVELVAGSAAWSLTTDTATGNASAIATALAASNENALKNYNWTSSGTKVIATEKAGFEGLCGDVTAVATQAVSGTLVVSVANPTAAVRGVVAVPAHFICPIIKLEADSEETEFTEDELPALTIFLKADTEISHEWFPKKQQHDITACKYYGVALTNDAKVVVSKFKEA